MPTTRLFPSGTPRSRVLLTIPLITALATLAACIPPPSTAPPSTTTTSTTTTVAEPTGPEVVGEACPRGSGVTVVVDFTDLDDTVRIGCAEGAPANGFAALAATGFTITDESGAGTICTIDGLPTEGFPFCWLTGGFWSYWKAADRDTAWSFSNVGAGTGPLAEGSVEGWTWAGGFSSAAPRVSIEQLDALTPTPVCAVPEAPVLSIISELETLPFTVDGDGPIEVAVQDAADDPADAVYSETDALDLDGLSGPTRVLARSADDGCEVVEQFDAVYDVRPLYTGRPDLPGSDSNAVAATSPSIIGWATGYTNYLPGTDVTENFQTPANAVGPYTTSLVVLGNAGEITMTFDTPITDGPGDDFAVFENGFTSGSAEALFTEVAYVEVSSNGTDFVRFDSASRQATPVGSFGFQDPRLLGGLAGKDPGGWGTAFDLTALANSAEVRDGTVDLSAITHVRIIDVVGAPDYPNPGDRYPDSFGRDIYDAHLTVGSGGFDLRAVGVLNQG